MTSASSPNSARNPDGNQDRRLLLWMSLLMLVLIVGVSLFAPRAADKDPRPTVTNTGPAGAKAAYLMLRALGRNTQRWTQPIAQLDDLPAATTTVVLAQPQYPATQKDEIAAALQRFLARGGRVLITGGSGALLLPGGAAAPSHAFLSDCLTTPGTGPLASAGRVLLDDASQWTGKAPGAKIAQRCGQDAVVVELPVGRGEAIWWSSAAPLTNAQLRHDADLRLLLLTLGEGRTVLWDESLQSTVPSFWSAARGLPLGWLSLQVAAIVLLLVLSYSRRNGPIRAPLAVPRSSPTEFANSMGDLYEKGHATSAATEAARRRLLRVLTRDAGIPQAFLNAGPEAASSSLAARFGGDWSAVGDHLRQAMEASNEEIPPRAALALVRALGEDAERIRSAAGLHRSRSVTERAAA